MELGLLQRRRLAVWLAKRFDNLVEVKTSHLVFVVQQSLSPKSANYSHALLLSPARVRAESKTACTQPPR